MTRWTHGAKEGRVVRKSEPRAWAAATAYTYKLCTWGTGLALGRARVESGVTGAKRTLKRIWFVREGVAAAIVALQVHRTLDLALVPREWTRATYKAFKAHADFVETEVVEGLIAERYKLASGTGDARDGTHRGVRTRRAFLACTLGFGSADIRERSFLTSDTHVNSLGASVWVVRSRWAECAACGCCVVLIRAKSTVFACFSVENVPALQSRVTASEKNKA